MSEAKGKNEMSELENQDNRTEDGLVWARFSDCNKHEAPVGSPCPYCEIKLLKRRLDTEIGHGDELAWESADAQVSNTAAQDEIADLKQKLEGMKRPVVNAAIDLADEWAWSIIESEGIYVDVEGEAYIDVSVAFGDYIEKPLMYLELRGALLHNRSNPSLVRLREGVEELGL